jgi:hypothetical protein
MSTCYFDAKLWFGGIGSDVPSIRAGVLGRKGPCVDLYMEEKYPFPSPPPSGACTEAVELNSLVCNLDI